MNNSLMLNDLSMDKSFQVNNNSMSATNRNKKDLNKSFSSMKNNNYLLSIKLSNLNNNFNNKKNENKIKNNQLKIKSIKESVKQIKDKIIKNQNQNNEATNNITKKDTQGSLVDGEIYSTMEENYQKNNSFIEFIKNKSLKHLNTLNNFPLKKDNSICIM